MSSITPPAYKTKQPLFFKRTENFGRPISLDWKSLLLPIVGLFGDRRDTGIGRIAEFDERKNRFAFEVPATGRHIWVEYNHELQSSLQKHLGELVEIHGNIISDKNENPFFIDRAIKFSLVDETEIRLSHVVPTYLQLKNVDEVFINVRLSKNKQYYSANYEYLEIITGAFSRIELENELRVYLDILWTDFAKESDLKLAQCAINLRQKLLSMFEEKSA